MFEITEVMGARLSQDCLEENQRLENGRIQLSADLDLDFLFSILEIQRNVDKHSK